jgi:hypothetical protein
MLVDKERIERTYSLKMLRKAESELCVSVANLATKMGKIKSKPAMVCTQTSRRHC